MKRPSGQSIPDRNPPRLTAKTSANKRKVSRIELESNANLDNGPAKKVVRIGRRISTKVIATKAETNKTSPENNRFADKKPVARKTLTSKNKRQLAKLGRTQKLRSRDSLSAQARRFTAHSRRRRAIFVTAFSAIAALFGLVAATIFTPMLAVEKITVSGLGRLKEATIQKALEPLKGVPLTLISEETVSSALSKFSLIESFSLVAVPPHEVLVKIVERTPIAIVRQNGTEYLYDPAGIRLGKAGNAKLPRIELENNPKNSAEFRAAIEVILALPADLLPRIYSINAKSKDDVTLELRGASGQSIIWGDGSNSVLKSKVLAALIKNHKKSDSVTFDVSSPNAPVVRY